jgi:glycosyltransferase involved in cell wall biosynthesis
MLYLAGGLANAGFDLRAVALGPPKTWADELQRLSIPLNDLNWKRPFDVRPFVALRSLIKSPRPEVVHAWGTTAARAIALTRSFPLNRLLISDALPISGIPGWMDRQLFRRVGVIAWGEAEASRYRALGVAPNKVHVLPPAVEPAGEVGLAQSHGIPPQARVILGVGPIEPHKGFREAVWAFDILAQIYSDLYLVIAGRGSDRPRVEAFARSIHVEHRVHFLGPVDDLNPWRTRAEIAWTPSLQEGGHCATLEALAAGLPVVATGLPGLTEIVANGQTGFLVPPKDKAELARRTRSLLEDPALRRRLGDAGRRAAGQWSVARLAQEAMPLYSR